MKRQIARYGAALCLFAAMFAATPATSAERSPNDDRRVESLQRGLMGLLDGLDKLRAQADANVRRQMMDEHWKEARAFLSEALSDHSGADRERSVGSIACELSRKANPKTYVAEMKDLLWDHLRGALADVHQVQGEAQRQQIRKVADTAYQGFQVIRGHGFRDGKAMPSAAADSLPDSASEGAYLVRLYCTQCHAAPTPVLHSAEEWGNVLTKMDTHAGLANMVDRRDARPIADRALRSIEAYMRGHACDLK